ncbi:unnamed protein product [Linum trigynum]|uniref:Uncharacterized protein n=1 Tax=Linum trigynum TaxID=586398 RepID=A0AAV2D3Y2_9ROSI
MLIHNRDTLFRAAMDRSSLPKFSVARNSQSTMDRASFLAPPPPDSQLFHYTHSTALLKPPTTATADSLKWHHQLQYNFHQHRQEEGSFHDDYMGCV